MSLYRPGQDESQANLAELVNHGFRDSYVVGFKLAAGARCLKC